MITIVTIIKWQNISLSYNNSENLLSDCTVWYCAKFIIYCSEKTNITVKIAIFKQLTKAQRDKVSAASCAGKFF